ncbi:MAG TPA: carbohydrate-binding protein [Vicinamibacterales bacterium]|nr:carbohydrate-binding protein [Vicinamibacterales bacterium]
MLGVRSTNSHRYQPTIGRKSHTLLALITAIFTLSLLPSMAAAANDVVIYSSDVTTIKGDWKRASDSSTAGGQKMVSVDRGWSRTGGALASPSHYFEAKFAASANTAYRVWVRMKAAGNSTRNDSVYMQFSDAVNSSGNAIWRIGTTSAILFALERCSDCGVSGWGWRGGSWWTGTTSIVRFPSSGTRTLRVQTREDGVAIDQIVLSPVTYYSKAPGAAVNDTTIVPQSGSGSADGASTSVKAIPGAIQAEDFDSGGSGVSYWDSTSGNAGGQYRNTNVDIERASEGGYDIGWTTRGEWLQYTVNVAKSGTYTLEARVASYGQGGKFRVEFGGVNKTGSLTIPNTGGWQTWTMVRKSVSLSAGQQRMRVVFESVGPSGSAGNLTYIRFIEGGTTTSSGSSSTSSGSRLRVMTWNVQQGRTAGGSYDLSGQVSVMANSGADVIVLQEVSTWDEYQPSKYRDTLASRTGRTWYSVWAPSKTSGGCLGTMILSKYPISGASSKIFYDTGMAKGTVTVNGVPVTIMTAHLSYYETSKRTSQLYALMDWARQFSGPVIVGGDFNSWWGEWWIKHMLTEFTDTWYVVKGTNEGGYTTGNVRFDYLFRSRYNGHRATPTACWVISTDRSDHRPVVADYTVQ